MKYKRRMSVHPHARGEHSLLEALRMISAGSSPREWGTLGAFLYSQHQRRFIPTRVGNTRWALSRARRRAVHPHARGEHLNTITGAQLQDGSSPRAWGTHSPPPALSSDIRFIPTRVGNTQQARQGLRD